MAKTAKKVVRKLAPRKQSAPVRAKPLAKRAAPKAAARKPAPKPIKKTAATKSTKKGSSGRGGNATVSAMRPDNQSTVTIKEISNGFLLTESSYANGKYREVQTFTPSKPKISVAPTK